MRHRIVPILLILSFCLAARAQVSYWFQGWQRQGNAQQAAQYFMLPGTNITFTYDAGQQHVIINSSGGSGTNTGPPGPTGPAGPQGPAGASGSNGVSATIAAGLVYTNAAGSAAGVTNRGTSTAAIFDFTLPVGPTGPQGPPGPGGGGGSVITNIWTTNSLGFPVGSLVVDPVTHSNRFRVISPTANNTLFAAADFTLNFSGTYDSGNWANDYGSIEVANRDQTDGNVAYFSFSGHALSGYSTAVIGSVIRSHTGYGGDLFFWLRDPANSNPANNFATRMTIKGGGNVGIGTDLPTAGLQVYSLTDPIFKVSGTSGDNLFSVASSGVATGNAAGLTNAAHTLFNATNAPPGVLGYDGANWYWSTPSYGSLFVLKSGDTMSGSLSNWSGNVTIRSSNTVASLNFEVPSGTPGVWQGAFVQLSTNGNLYMGAPAVFNGGLHVEQFVGVDAGGISPTGVHYGNGSLLSNVVCNTVTSIATNVLTSSQVTTGLGYTPLAAISNAVSATAATSATNVVPGGNIVSGNATLTGSLWSTGIVQRLEAGNLNTLVVTNGKVGIGLATPSYALDVSGSINVSSSILQAGGNMIPSTTLLFDYAHQDTRITRLSPGTLRIQTNAVLDGTLTATNGFTSKSRNLLAPVSISVTGSPFNWTNSLATNNISVFIDGAGVTGTVGLNGTTIFTALTGADATVPLQPREYVTVTYTIGTPVMFWKPF